MKIRKQTFTLEQYLKDMNKKYVQIRNARD